MAAAFLLITPLALRAQSAADVAGTLPEDYLPGLKAILETARQQSPTMQLQNISLAQAAAALIQADSILWPNAGASFSYAWGGARTDTGVASTSSGGYYGFSVSQPIFQWGAYLAQANISKLSQQVAQHQFADAFRGLANALRSQYMGLVTAKIALRNTRYQFQLLEAGLAIQEEMLKEGSISEGDINAPRLAVREQRLTLQRAELDYDHAKNLFRRLAGLDDLADELIPGDLARPAYTESKADALVNSFTQAGGAENTLQGQMYRLNLKQQDLYYKIAKTGLYYPKFSFSGGYGLSLDTISQSAVTSYSYGINANLPLFNGFSTRGGKLAALAGKRSVERQFKSHVDETVESVQNMRKRLNLAVEGMDIAETYRALAQDGLKRATEELKEGTVSKTNVETATTAFNVADYGAITSRVAYLNLWSEFVSLVGADPTLHALPASYLNLNHGK